MFVRRPSGATLFLILHFQGFRCAPPLANDSRRSAAPNPRILPGVDTPAAAWYPSCLHPRLSGGTAMRVWGRWGLALLVAAAVVGVPTAYYRATYAHAKRLRVVEPGVAYRSGQLTAAGFREAFRRYKIGVVVNLQEEARDPLVPEGWQARPSVTESEVCKQAGVRYVSLDGGVLDHPDQEPGVRPRAIDQFLDLMDEARAEGRPVLFHCKAGLHRTGLLAAIYRMEYDGWTKARAVRELRANGFGTFAATEANDYVKRFVVDYEPGLRHGQPRAVKAAVPPSKAGN